ncbi:type IV secretion system protein, partial [Acinetobacter baumannii]
QQQLTQAQQLYGSINKLTSMGDIATVLKDPNIRQVLPQSFSQVEGALTGQGTGAIGTSASSFLSQNSTYTTPGNDFYAQQLKATANNNAGTLG